MPSSYSSWAAPSLARYRPAILALTAIAAGCTIYYLHEQIWPSLAAPKPSLQRSNARRRRRHRSRRPGAGNFGYVVVEGPRYLADAPWGTVPVSLDFLTDVTIDQETLGDHLFRSTRGDVPGITTSLRRRMPPVEAIRAVTANDEEAEIIRRELEEAFLCFYFWKHIAPSPLTAEQQGLIVSQLRENGSFSAEIITSALQWHQAGTLTEHIERWQQIFESRREAYFPEENLRDRDPVNGDLSSTMQALEGHEAVVDLQSEHSWRSLTHDGLDDSKGHDLGNLLWRIAEEQARKESYVHRGVTCNSCNAMPIRGIRYHCSNCVDFDLCEQCEALQIHPRTHLFYKVRIPAPFLNSTRQPQPVWYPGRPTTVTYSIPKEIMEKIKKDTEYQAVEIEALWEQFRCLAATEWDDDPSEYNLAIDRRTFDKCFVPNTSGRPPPPNLIYDRAFSFYDTDNNGLIGFGEFINGRAALSRKNPDERWKRIFNGYDINNDGFVDRRDFLRMFRAYYTLTKELTLDIINGMDDDVSEMGARDVVLGSQPISSAFSGAIPPGERLRTDEGKRRDEHGDYQIYDEIGGAVDDRDHEVADPNEVIADSVEAARFGHVQRKGIIGPWVGEVINNDKWPPGAITRDDLQKVFPNMNELNEVTSVKDQDAIRRVAHERVAREYQERQFVRRIALRNRKHRQSFYLDGGDDAKEEKQSESEVGPTATSLRKNDKSRKDDLTRILGSSKADEFRMRLVECIKAMDWPLHSPEKLMNDVFEMISNEWGGTEIAEDLSGYGSLQHDAEDFVATFDSIISLIGDAIKVPEVQEPGDEQRETFPSSSSRRSRSSSKVRFRDDVGTDDGHEPRSRATSISSRSVPLNERWGGFVPEPEKDVGREVLYQVTQEAFNELLDPVFRVREDLALAAVRTRRKRERHRTAIISSVKKPRDIKRNLDIYQKRWRLQKQSFSQGYLGTQEIEETWDADGLLAFMSLRKAGQLDTRTGEQCSRCKAAGLESWIWAGEFCRCGKPSAEAREPPVTDSPNLIICPGCPKGMLAPGKVCGSCGFLSKELKDLEEKLWTILRGLHESLVQDAVQDEMELKSTPNEEAEPLFPPQALEDLHSSVAAFNEDDSPALEEKIAQKPLADLLAESGYTATSSSITTSTSEQQQDPIIPQNRPNETHEPEPNLHSEGFSNTASNSLQPSLHTTQTQTSSVYLEEPPKSPPPDPTLPQYRPNSLTTPPRQPTVDSPASTSASASNSTPKITPKVTTNGVSSEQQPSQDQNSDADEGDDDSDDDDDDDEDDAPVDTNTLTYYAALDLLEAEDKERGGPGRLSFAEWQDVMKGKKGPALGFLGSWIEVASF